MKVTKSELLELKAMEQVIDGLTMRIRDLKFKLYTGIQAVNYEHEKVTESRVPSYETEELLDEIHRLEVEIQEHLTRLIRKEIMILREIYKLDLIQQNILIYRYEHGMSWDEVSMKVGYSKSRCYDFHAQALKRLEEIWEEEQTSE